MGLTTRDLLRFEMLICDYLEERRKQALEIGKQVDLENTMDTLHQCMENAAIDFAVTYNIDYEPVYR